MVEATSTRVQIRDELKAFAQTHIDNWESYAGKTFTSNDYGFQFESRQTEYNGCILTVSKAHVPGLTTEMHRVYRSDLANNIPKLDEKLSITIIPDIDGHKALIQHIKMPMILSNRSLVVCQYLIEHPDGSIEFITSSKGNEQAAAAHAAIIKKDVVANNIINYLKLTPTADGCDWISVQCLDIAGSVPDALKRQGAEKQAKMAMRIIHVVKTGQAPRD